MGSSLKSANDPRRERFRMQNDDPMDQAEQDEVVGEAAKTAAATLPIVIEPNLLAIMQETGLTRQQLDASGEKIFTDHNKNKRKAAFLILWAGVNAAALGQLPDDVIRLMCIAVRRGMKMLGDSAAWGIVMEAPSHRSALPRRMPPVASRADAPLRPSLLSPRFVHATPSSDKTQLEATFRCSRRAREKHTYEPWCCCHV